MEKKRDFLFDFIDFSPGKMFVVTDLIKIFYHIENALSMGCTLAEIFLHFTAFYAVFIAKS